MPIIKSAKKALRGSAKKRVYNERRKRAMRESIKDVKKLAADPKAAAAELNKAYQAIDKAAKRGTIHRNKANRLKSRVSKRLSATTK